MSGQVVIRGLEPHDAAGCDAVVASLPYHFGDPDGRAECAHAVRTEPGLTAADDDGVVGFLTWRAWFDGIREITWLAVTSDHRRTGVGGRLVETFAADALSHGARYLVVTTLSASSTEPGVTDGYEGTRRFYHKHAFVSLWEPKGWWNDENQALVLLRDLNR